MRAATARMLIQLIPVDDRHTLTSGKLAAFLWGSGREATLQRRRFHSGQS
jgi:hypothetical protein